MSRILGLVAAAAAVVAVTALPASAHTTSLPAYLVTGIETSVPTDGTSTFAGTAFSLRAGGATWKASVDHQSLDACASLSDPDTCIDGGTFSLSGRRSGTVAGAFTSGSITSVSGDPVGCTTSTTVYDVNGTVDAGASGYAAFHVRLTHYQTKVLGRCIAYFATVVGAFRGT